MHVSLREGDEKNCEGKRREERRKAAMFVDISGNKKEFQEGSSSQKC